MKSKYRFLVLGYAHLPVSRTFTSCAFTQKAINFAKMMCDLGHEVVYFGARGESSEQPIEEYINSENFTLIETHTLKDIRKDYGEGVNLDEANGIGYLWRQTQYKNDFNSERKPVTRKFYRSCINWIKENKRDDDFLCLMQGYYHKPIADAVNLYLTCEPGIGYRGSYAPFRAFESRYIQYFTYGSEDPRADQNGRYYDRVIGNYYNPDDFIFNNKPKDYYLFIGRLISRKGIWTAIKATESIGAKLKIAGQPSNEFSGKNLPENCEYVGQVGWKERSDLMGGAIATFVPTIYLEPFGGVAIESMFCGTPIITTNFGAFTDYNRDGVTGYKCNTLKEFVDAMQKVKTLNRKQIRKEAMFYSLENIRKEYLKWFDDLHNLWESAINPQIKGWHRL